jgi:hypothetical protein
VAWHKWLFIAGSPISPQRFLLFLSTSQLFHPTHCLSGA